MRIVIFVSFLCAGAFVLESCSVTPKQEPAYWPTDTWRTSTPEQQGFDSEALATALDVIETKKLPIHSLLLIRNGYLVLEAYFYPYSGETLHAWASVTKSITSTLIGLAVDQGGINGVKQRIVDFFPQYQQLLSGDKSRITVENLLTMTTGMECGYRQGEIEALEMQRSPDFVAAVLRLPMHTNPGSEFSYCSGGMHLLSAIVTRASGMSALQFARTRLFEPLGIKHTTWPADPQGINYGWANLRMYPRDMAKIGYLYLHKGEWEGKQVLSSDWVHQATSRQIDVPKSDVDYGYGWWIGPRDFSGLYQAMGRGGQRIVVWPEKNLVLIVNGAGLDPGQLTPLLLPSLKSDQALAENPAVYQQLQEKIALAARAPQPSTPAQLPARAHKVSGQKYVLEPNLLDIKKVSLRFEQPNLATFNLLLGNQEMTMSVGLDGLYRFTTPKPTDSMLALKGHWATDDEFILDYTEANGISNYQVAFVYEADKVTLHIKDLTELFPTQVVTGFVQTQ